MEATPIWFGPEDRPLLGWFHSPPGDRARAGVVVCPPLGRDYLQAHYALRMVAETLAELGLCVLRFDYDGTGDSAGDDTDPQRVASWTASVRSALEVVRAAGPLSVSLIGMRFGATLAAVVAEHDTGIDGLVLWDPVVSGAAYLAEQRAMTAFSSIVRSPLEDGAVEAPGMIFGPETARDLRSLDLTRTTGPLARRLLVLTRPDRFSKRLADHLALPHVQWTEATGQAELMDVGPPAQALPLATMAKIAHWTADLAPTQTHAIQRPAPAGPAVVDSTATGLAVTETPVFVGPHGLFGILCETEGCGPGPTVLFLSVANEHRMGPARLWADLSRRWAAAGLRCFRVDLSSLGDSPLRHPEQLRFRALGVEAFDDITDVTRFVCPDDPSNVVLVGLCSSAYQAIESAFLVNPRGVVAIQPVLSFQPREMAEGGSMDPRRRIAMPRNSLVQAFHGDGPLSGFGAIPGSGLAHPAVGRTAPTRGRMAAKPQPQRSRPVPRVRGVGGPSHSPRGLESENWRGLARTGRFRFEYHPELQHGLLSASQRSTVVEMMTEHVLSHFASAPSARSAPSGANDPSGATDPSRVPGPEPDVMRPPAASESRVRP